MKILVSALCIVLLLLNPIQLSAEDGYKLWLRYERISDQPILRKYTTTFQSVYRNNDPTSQIAEKEFILAFKELTGKKIVNATSIESNSVVMLTSDHSLLQTPAIQQRIASVNEDGFVIVTTTLQGKKCTVITSRTTNGVLYGTFHLLRLLQQNEPTDNLDITSSPSVKHRILNHWDNLDRTVERGYAGFSLWDWHRLPGYIDARYYDYARANASIGINGTVLTNVNANALILTEPYLEKVKALAEVFRPYGIKVYLTARFSAPMEIGGLSTADPADKQVQKWWADKVDQIYQYIPDFGGFLVKANSEGQPGPQNYGRSHADGANMLAKPLAAHGGIVMWRAFVYDNEVPVDRVKQAYNEFKPLDGSFLPNVIVQVKNGPLDFQPREPFHPLFGAMPKTPLMIEFQLTQEYLGFATHLVYLGSLFKETLESDTYVTGKGSTVQKVIDGSLHQHPVSAMAGVANIGNDRNWCGHPFAQANWYAFGRLSWDLTLTAEQISKEWTRQTFSNNAMAVNTISTLMMKSRQTTVNYMTPLGLHHIMGWDHHYGPAPWIKDKPRADWTSVYYHKADSQGVGFDRTASGSNALEQYHPDVRRTFANVGSCPEDYLLWFHHVSWKQKMKSGRTLWEELCYRYYDGAAEVQNMQQQWKSMRPFVDEERFSQVTMLLNVQYEEARWWRNSCVLYFQQFSGMEIPAGLSRPDKSLNYYESLSFPFAPGIRPKW